MLFVLYKNVLRLLSWITKLKRAESRQCAGCIMLFSVTVVVVAHVYNKKNIVLFSPSWVALAQERKLKKSWLKMWSANVSVSKILVWRTTLEQICFCGWSECFCEPMYILICTKMIAHNLGGPRSHKHSQSQLRMCVRACTIMAWRITFEQICFYGCGWEWVLLPTIMNKNVCSPYPTLP